MSNKIKNADSLRIRLIACVALVGVCALGAWLTGSGSGEDSIKVKAVQDECHNEVRRMYPLPAKWLDAETRPYAEAMEYSAYGACIRRHGLNTYD
jgi:hypothetical protein